MKRSVLAVCGLVTIGCGSSDSVTSPPIPLGDITLQLVPVATGFSSPTFLTTAGDDRLFVVEQPGRIRIVQNGTVSAGSFLDISSKVLSGGERGLLSMAFHPSYATNGFFFVYYTDLNGDIRVERYTVSSSNPNQADPSSAKLIISIPHPVNANHNGGLLQFGPDGMLYIGTGDGGGAGDPAGNAQNLNVLLGKILRINVDVSGAYAIPPNNPFVNQASRRGEIWMYGLRNPWRFAFDPTSELLYIADVGQDKSEEIDVVSNPLPATPFGGLNFGWPTMEGYSCFSVPSCNPFPFTLPTFTYDHSSGQCSVVGGYVYRGTASALVGAYLYSDYCAGWLKSFKFVGGTVTEQHDWGIQSIGHVLSFGRDRSGELYMLGENGTVYRIAVLLPA